jgi:hypothetical protein
MIIDLAFDHARAENQTVLERVKVCDMYGNLVFSRELRSIVRTARKLLNFSHSFHNCMDFLMAMFVSAACVCSRGSSTDNNFRLPTRCLQIDYIFGGFNFLMWIAFVVTTVCVHEFYSGQCFTPFLSFRTSLWKAPALSLSTSELQFYWYVWVYVVFQFIYAPQMLVIIISTTFYAFVDWNASRIMNPSSLLLRTKPL